MHSGDNMQKHSLKLISVLLSAMAVSACGGGDTKVKPFAPPPPPVNDVIVEPPAKPDILEALQNIEGLTVVEVAATQQDYRTLKIEMLQPTDHNDENSATFTQRMTLLFKDYDAPTVLVETGYTLFENQLDIYLLEPTQLTGANQLVVEHRFFLDSRPQNPDWSLLNIEQAAGDGHNIVQTFNVLFENVWMGTGVSKGGMTTIFHHYFHPEDFDAIIPYVAPISLGIRDPRYQAHLAQLGTDACRERLEGIQREGVDRVEAIVDINLAGFPNVNRELYRSAVLDTILGFSWGYWQYYGVEGCLEQIPAFIGDDNVLAQWFAADPTYTEQPYPEGELDPYSYQVLNELGGQSFYTGHVDDLLPEGYSQGQWTDTILARPWGEDPEFDASAMPAILEWLENDAPNVWAIYGAYDPWSGGIVSVDASNDSKVFVAPRASHGASIFDLEDDDRNDILTRLGALTDAPVLENAGLSFASPAFLSAPHRAYVQGLLNAQGHTHGRLLRDRN